jgi:hypothetical protein
MLPQILVDGCDPWTVCGHAEAFLMQCCHNVVAKDAPEFIRQQDF